MKEREREENERKIARKEQLMSTITCRQHGNLALFCTTTTVQRNLNKSQRHRGDNYNNNTNNKNTESIEKLNEKRCAVICSIQSTLDLIFLFVNLS